MKTPIPLFLIIFSLTCFAFSSKSQAVVPPPDGGYPGCNTAEGHLALASLNTSAGLYNTAVGVYSLLSITDGDLGTALGAGTLFANTAPENTVIGAGVLFKQYDQHLKTRLLGRSHFLATVPGASTQRRFTSVVCQHYRH
jgi:hypothetical protein